MCRSPILPPEGSAGLYTPQGDAPLPAPPIGGDLHGHLAEPIMLRTEAMVNPAGPPEVSGDWPAAPNLPHQVTYEPDGTAPKIPYVTSDAVAEAWRVDHDKLCGKLLGHRRRSGNDNNPPPTFLPVGDGLLAVQPPGNRPHPGLVGQAHRVQRAPGRLGDHPRPVAARRKDACLSPGNLQQGAHAPLPAPLARRLEA